MIATAIFWRANIAVARAGDAKPPSQYIYKTIGTRKLTIDIDYPPRWKPTDKRPTIVFFFGGAWKRGTPQQFKPQAVYFSKRGLVCCRPDYRVRSTDGVTPDKCVEDAISAMRWVRAHAAQLGIDPQRIVAAGGSAGGHLAACTFFIDLPETSGDNSSISPKPNAMILYNPPLNLFAMRSTADRKLVRGLSDSELKRISPLLCDAEQLPPTLLIDGTKDRFNPQIREFERKYRSLGAPIQAYYAEGQPHSFFNKSPWIEKTTEEADRFLCRIGYLSQEPKVQLPTRKATPASQAKSSTQK